MGMVETVGAVATALTALLALGVKLWRAHKAKAAKRYADAEAMLAAQIHVANSEDERMRLAKELFDLRSGK